MCKECGCENNLKVDNDKKHSHTHAAHASSPKKIIIDKSITDVNDSLARHISNNLKELGVLCINMMGSPGSGKTSVIEGISKYISPNCIAVIQGDLESDIDKKRLEKINIETHQINTHSGCHLNSAMINKALLSLNLKGKKYLIIENVGNLVCPAGVSIGQHMNVVVSSTTEGSDKPKKYPYIFIESSLIVISKMDLAENVDFNEKEYVHDLVHINGYAKILKTSKKDAASFRPVAGFFEHERMHILGKGHKH